MGKIQQHKKTQLLRIPTQKQQQHCSYFINIHHPSKTQTRWASQNHRHTKKTHQIDCTREGKPTNPQIHNTKPKKLNNPSTMELPWASKKLRFHRFLETPVRTPAEVRTSNDSPSCSSSWNPTIAPPVLCKFELLAPLLLSVDYSIDRSIFLPCSLISWASLSCFQLYISMCTLKLLLNILVFLENFVLWLWHASLVILFIRKVCDVSLCFSSNLLSPMHEQSSLCWNDSSLSVCTHHKHSSPSLPPFQLVDCKIRHVIYLFRRLP